MAGGAGVALLRRTVLEEVTLNFVCACMCNPHDTVHRYLEKVALQQVGVWFVPRKDALGHTSRGVLEQHCTALSPSPHPAIYTHTHTHTHTYEKLLDSYN